MRIQFYKLNEVTPKSFIFPSSPIASEHSVFSTHRSFSLWSTRYPDELVSKEATSEAAILKLSWQLGCVYVMSFRPTRNWREGEKPATDLASFTRSAKSIFFQAIIHFTIFKASISEFGASLAQEQPFCIKLIYFLPSFYAFIVHIYIFFPFVFFFDINIIDMSCQLFVRVD